MGDNMKDNNFYITNSQKVLDLICDGCDTIADLSEAIGISQSSIQEICNKLIDKGLINKSFFQRNKEFGRPALKFSISSCHFSAYIEERRNKFSCILIDVFGKAVERFDKIKNPYTDTETIISRFLRDISCYDNKRGLCRGIFIDCTNKTSKVLNEEFTRICKEELIADSLKNGSEASLFLFKKMSILNLYGNLSKSTVDKNILIKSFNFHKIYEFKEPYYDEIFSALSKITFDRMKELITK